MPDITWIHPGLSSILRAIPVEVRSLVDLGCGRGIIGALCRIYREPERLVGLDCYEPYLEFCKKMRFYDESVLWDLRKTPLPFQDKEFEVTTCIEVIEHLPKQAGSKLLDELDRVAWRIILTTPNTFFDQPSFDMNIHQQHLALWRPKDFKRRGYKVYGIGNMKIFARPARYISPALGKLTWPFPDLSTLVLCVKDTLSNDSE